MINPDQLLMWGSARYPRLFLERVISGPVTHTLFFSSRIVGVSNWTNETRDRVKKEKKRKKPPPWIVKWTFWRISWRSIRSWMKRKYVVMAQQYHCFHSVFILLSPASEITATTAGVKLCWEGCFSKITNSLCTKRARTHEHLMGNQSPVSFISAMVAAALQGSWGELALTSV